MSENTVNLAFRRMGFDKTEVTAHGLRATASTLLNECGLWNPDAIERALAHGFSDAVREDLPASIASDVVMVVTPKMGAAETFSLQIDDSGESWVADAHPLGGGDMIKLTYKLRGEPFEIEIPFAP